MTNQDKQLAMNELFDAVAGQILRTAFKQGTVMIAGGIWLSSAEHLIEESDGDDDLGISLADIGEAPYWLMNDAEGSHEAIHDEADIRNHACWQNFVEQATKVPLVKLHDMTADEIRQLVENIDV